MRKKLISFVLLAGFTFAATALSTGCVTEQDGRFWYAAIYDQKTGALAVGAEVDFNPGYTSPEGFQIWNKIDSIEVLTPELLDARIQVEGFDYSSTEKNTNVLRITAKARGTGQVLLHMPQGDDLLEVRMEDVHHFEMQYFDRTQPPAESFTAGRYVTGPYRFDPAWLGQILPDLRQNGCSDCEIHVRARPISADGESLAGNPRSIKWGLEPAGCAVLAGEADFNPWFYRLNQAPCLLTVSFMGIGATLEGQAK